MSEPMLPGMEIRELAGLVRRREISAVELSEACLDRIDACQGDTNAFVTWDRSTALEQARRCDGGAAAGRFVGPLHGIPIAVKDNYLTADFPTTAGSKVCPGTIGVDAKAVARLKRAGAIIVGKTNMHEWAYGATNEVSAFGPTRNPWNSAAITGGSSGGSGAALAARMVPAALGSDTGGSVRIPAAACGVSGIKPTYGMTSRQGVLPLSWSLDVAGPMARSAADLDLLLRAMSEGDWRQGSELPDTHDELATLLRGRRFAVPRGPGFERSEEVSAVFDRAVGAFTEQGAVVEEIEIDEMETGFAIWKVILHCEAAAYHAQSLEDRYDDYSDNVRSQLEAGRCMTAVDYLRAQQFRERFNSNVTAALAPYDALLLPTLPVTAPRIGQEFVRIADRSVSCQDAMTYVAWVANMTGLPAVSVPCGFDRARLPVGLMMIGSASADHELLKIASAYQAVTDWHLCRPIGGEKQAQGELA